MTTKLPIFHRAITYSRFGEPADVLRISKVHRPDPGPREVLVRMKLRAINPSDLITIRGAYSRVSLPRVAGFEGFGTVVQVGDEAAQAGAESAARSSIQTGSRVLALKGQHTWQEYMVTPADEVVVIPDAIDDQTAAQLYINPLTAWLMLKYKLKVRAEDTLIVNAGNSACGYVIARFAALFGLNLISVVRRSDCAERLRAAGAKLVINTSGASGVSHTPSMPGIPHASDTPNTDLQSAVHGYTRGAGGKFALDAIGGEAGAQLANCVQAGGTMLHYGLLSGVPLAADVYASSAKRNVTIENYWLKEWLYTEPAAHRQKVFKEMMNAFIQLGIRLPAECEYALEDVAEAVRHAELPGRNGKVLLDCRAPDNT